MTRDNGDTGNVNCLFILKQLSESSFFFVFFYIVKISRFVAGQKGSNQEEEENWKKGK